MGSESRRSRRVFGLCRRDTGHCKFVGKDTEQGCRRLEPSEPVNAADVERRRCRDRHRDTSVRRRARLQQRRRIRTIQFHLRRASLNAKRAHARRERSDDLWNARRGFPPAGGLRAELVLFTNLVSRRGCPKKLKGISSFPTCSTIRARSLHEANSLVFKSTASVIHRLTSIAR